MALNSSIILQAGDELQVLGSSEFFEEVRARIDQEATLPWRQGARPGGGTNIGTFMGLPTW